MLTPKTSAPDRRHALSRFGLGLLGALPVVLSLLAVPQSSSADVGQRTTLYTFTGAANGDGCAFGAFGSGGGPLVLDASGDLYGTTGSGGASDLGTVFSVPPGFPEDFVLHSFQGTNRDGNMGEGSVPNNGLIFDSVGNLYGTTAKGGTNDSGTVFRLAPDGTLTTLHNFSGGADGGQPLARLALDNSGNLTGTTAHGGKSDSGTVFRLTGSGKFVSLYSFTGGNDGAHPLGDLVFDKAGNLYGTTSDGGEAGGESGFGTVFELTTLGRLVTLHTFRGEDPGVHPYAGLVFDRAGNLYGTTFEGGMFGPGTSNTGTVFKLAPNGTPRSPFTTLHSFKASEGAYPAADLVFDSAGNLYGTTWDGPERPDHFLSGGIVFRLSRDTRGALTSFTTVTSNSGFEVMGGLAVDSFGAIYGTTEVGPTGSAGCGTVFAIFNAAPVGPKLIPGFKSLNFRDITIGGVTTGNTRSVNIRVKGGNYIPQTPLLTGPNAGEFSITSNSCTGTIAGGGNCTLTLRYTRNPNDPSGQNSLATLNLTGDAALAIPLIGAPPG